MYFNFKLEQWRAGVFVPKKYSDPKMVIFEISFGGGSFVKLVFAKGQIVKINAWAGLFSSTM